MRRRVRLGVLSVVLFMAAGCLGFASSGSPSTATPTENPQLTPKPLPDQPDELTRENVVSFVKEYEKRHFWNQELTNNTTSMTVSPRVETLNETDEGYVVHLEVGTTEKFRSDGALAVADGLYRVNYFINATTIQRAQEGG